VNSSTPRPQDRFFDSNGVPIRYVVQGDGPAVVLLHGYTGSLDHWIDIGYTNGPFDGYQLIAMDCRGHGQSGKPHDPVAYGLEMVNDIVRLLDHLEIEHAHLVGHSMGAEIALKMAAQYPARVQSAVLAGSGWSDDSVYELWGMLAESFERGEGLHAYLEWATPPGQFRTAEEIEGFEQWNQAMLARNDAQALAAVCRNFADLEELRVTEDEVRALQVPVLGVAGERDAERPMLERMQGVAPDFTMVVLAGLGHGGPTFFETLAGEAMGFLHRISSREIDKGPKPMYDASNTRALVENDGES
jgi:pimeloyl-ACP methyl ester carboxylesterase